MVKTDENITLPKGSIETKTTKLNLGPTHPATHGVFQNILELDGEKIVSAEQTIGYVHRAIEKIAERRPLYQITPLTDRLNYCSSPINNMGWHLTCEKLLGIQTPKRVDYLRVIIMELARIGDHLICNSVVGVDSGAYTGFLYLMQYRELIYEIWEEICGARLTTNIGRIGGFERDFNNIAFTKLERFLKEYPDALTEFEKVLTGRSTKGITERALRYDLTIPFARYVAINYGQLTFPFKRYQVQPVWRADRPQRGRYREFYQCDADVVGSNALINEVEFVHIYHSVFNQLGIKNYELRINSRKLLTALAERCGGGDRMIDITIAIDKLDKIGVEKVKEELRAKNINSDQIAIIENYLNIQGSNEEKLAQIKTLFTDSAVGLKGAEEIEYILKTVNDQPSTINVIVDFTLARGLNYYTGVIFEAKAPAEVKIGSIGGGGRYDDLTGLFGVPNVPGVGISFGVDRIYDVLEELNLFPQTVESGTKILFFNLGDAESKKAYEVVQELRLNGIASELFHEPAKMDKQFKYAEKKNIPFVGIIGSKELEAQNVVLKDIKSGEQKLVSITDFIQQFQSLI